MPRQPSRRAASRVLGAIVSPHDCELGRLVREIPQPSCGAREGQFDSSVTATACNRTDPLTAVPFTSTWPYSLFLTTFLQISVLQNPWNWVQWKPRHVQCSHPDKEMPVKLWMGLCGSGCATRLLLTCLLIRVCSNPETAQRDHLESHLALDRHIHPFKLSDQNNQELEHLKPTKSSIVKNANSLLPHQLGSSDIFLPIWRGYHNFWKHKVNLLQKKVVHYLGFSFSSGRVKNLHCFLHQWLPSDFSLKNQKD